MPLPKRAIKEQIVAHGDTGIHRVYHGPTSSDDEGFWVEEGDHETASEGTEIRLRLVEAVDSERLRKAGLSDDAKNLIKTVDGPIESGDIIQLRGEEWLCRDVTEHRLNGDPYYWVLGVVEYGG